MTYCDAHFHLVQCGKIASINDCTHFYACTCAHSPQEFKQQEFLASLLPPERNIILICSYGIHPQMPIIEYSSFLEQLLKKKKIQAIGEAGFDLFTEEYKKQIDDQNKVWNVQLDFAVQYGVPLVVHCRKSVDLLFRDCARLSKVPSVIFHSFSGTSDAAYSLLRKKINGYFSFGKPLINGAKKARDCLVRLPPDRILLETDAPYQILKGEKKTLPEEIVRVYLTAAEMRQTDVGELSLAVEKNFCNAYRVAR